MCAASQCSCVNSVSGVLCPELDLRAVGGGAPASPADFKQYFF